MKYGNNKPTPEQQEMIRALRYLGNKVSICYSADAAREVIRNYLERAEGFNLVNCEEAVKQWDKCLGIPKEIYPYAPCENCQYYQNNDKE